jgi:hypothetical protein
MASAANVTAHTLVDVHLGPGATPCDVRIRHARATRPMRTTCDKSHERSTVRLFRDAVSDDAARRASRAAPPSAVTRSAGAGCAVDRYGPRAFERRAATLRAETPRSRASYDAAVRRSLHGDGFGLLRRRARPVRHVSVGRVTILPVVARGACVKAFCQLSLPVESPTALSAEPAISPNARRSPSAASHADERRGGTAGRRRASDLCEKTRVRSRSGGDFTPKRISERAVAISTGLPAAARSSRGTFQGSSRLERAAERTQ